MPCYYPIVGYQAHGGGQLSFYEKKDHNTVTIPCGQCIGCRLKISREWATRCMHEKQMHKHNCTITLTYNDEHLPKDKSLHYEDFQKFLKRLRKICLVGNGRFAMRNTEHLTTSSNYAKIQPEHEVRLEVMTESKVEIETDRILNPGTLKGKSVEGPGSSPGPSHFKIRFYMGGEYGELTQRPHYHACLFGIDFKDKIYNRTTPAGFKIYTSPTLDKLWKKGYASIGDLTFESAAYIARYIMKKRTGKHNNKSYEIADIETGEITIRKKEFNQMSRKPGIGKAWLEKYEKDIYPHGKVIIRGHRANTPRYYDKIWKEQNALQFEDLQNERQMVAMAQTEHHTPERLKVQEQVQIAKTKSLKRNLE